MASKTSSNEFSLLQSTKEVLQQLLNRPECSHLPNEVKAAVGRVDIVGQDASLPHIPCPFRESEIITSLKVIEAAYALLLCDLKLGTNVEHRATVDINHATGFLFLAFLSTIDGIDKLMPEHYKRLLDTDIHQSQSNVYRLAMTNMLKTKDGYFQFHGGLNATLTFDYLDLPAARPELTDYRECCRIIEERTSKYTNAELDRLCASAKQAGTPVYNRKEYLATDHGATENEMSWMTCETLERETAPVDIRRQQDPYLLSGVKVLDLTRVIAGPLIGRTIAEYGADVLRVHNLDLPDVPYYQVDLNYGKHTTHIDLKSEKGRKTFEELLQDVDVIIDGYRPGVLDKLGYGPAALLQRFTPRSKGFVYLSENCHGWKGTLQGRSGWQQIADASTGVSAAQGEFWGKGDEPVPPPFPMADFGTGEMGAIAILHGLHLRATKGGSYHLKVSLCAYNNLTMNIGQYPTEIKDDLRAVFNKNQEVAKLGHASNFNIVGRAALEAMKIHSPHLWSGAYMTESRSLCFGPSPKEDERGQGAIVRTQKGVVTCPAKQVNFCRSTRFNGYDDPSWSSFSQDTFA